MRLLDRPVWNALTSGWAALAEGDARAWRLKRNYGVFGAAPDRSPESLAALAALVPAGGELWMVEKEPWPTPPGTRVDRSAACVQMVAEVITGAPKPPFEIVPLGEGDAPEMFALATLTEPGPYAAHTNRLGAFVGVRQDGRLVAMAGERMRMPGLAEVSGVCTHPEFRGRGYAGALMRTVAQRMLARGETPFLHAYATNAGAITLYESLGFRVDGEVTASVLVRAE
ncbi:GNAT family N-acetyltransferase [Sphingomonas sp. DT-204]|uniref:GNAT family N-acetyltransferase n=1 Tax=Sphingomonas sp. DT-204 TaxID=3396166 RepID=UPI003F1BFECB